MDNNTEKRKRAAILRFAKLDRRGLIDLDWSGVAETGPVKIRVKIGRSKIAVTFEALKLRNLPFLR